MRAIREEVEQLARGRERVLLERARVLEELLARQHGESSSAEGGLCQGSERNASVAEESEEEVFCAICGEYGGWEDEEWEEDPDVSLSEAHFASLAADIRCPGTIAAFCRGLDALVGCDATGSPPRVRPGEIYPCYGGCCARAHADCLETGWSKFTRSGQLFGCGWMLSGPGYWCPECRPPA